MKTITSGMASHLSQEVTTLCTCWKIVRQDGEVFGFTDHDMDLTFNGLLYESDTGYNRSAIRTDGSLAVDNLDVSGFLESDRISENDLRNGLFDFANVYIFAVNWADPTMQEIKLRRGWFGEVSLNQNGMFETEVRGLHQALAFGFMQSYQPECRADFCDTRCKLKQGDFTRAGFAYDWTSRSQFIISAGDPTGMVLSKGEHRYWRLDWTVAGTYGDFTSFAEINFYDQDNAQIIGGTASASSGAAGSARDRNAGTAWSSSAGDQLGWWQIDFGIPKEIMKVTLQAPTNNPTSAAVGFNLQYSDDGVTWTTAYTYSTPSWANPSETRAFVGYDGPGYSPMPVPSTGATDYIGGTVKFTTGDNAGKIIEITEFDAATGLVTMFEGFPYAITPGDALELVQGCDKRFETCKLYGNQVNFRGEPHVPGQDEYLKYADPPEE